MDVNEATDWAWFAGLFEGEGFFYAPRSRWQTRRFNMAISMTDRDVLARAQSIAGGHLRKHTRKYREDMGHKPAYLLKLTTHESLDAIAIIWQYLCERRREQAITFLTERLDDLAYPDGKIAHETRETIHFLTGGAWM